MRGLTREMYWVQEYWEPLQVGSNKSRNIWGLILVGNRKFRNMRALFR